MARKKTNISKPADSKPARKKRAQDEVRTTARKKTTSKRANDRKDDSSLSAASDAESADQSDHFPIVGIGASAGGLVALQQLFESVPEDPGLAFVVVQHLDPTRKSLTPELLARCTRLPVTEIEDGVQVTRNQVFVMPSGKYLTIADGVLRLTPSDRPRGERMAIDFFFRSLATDQRQCAIGVILSGSGTDGTLGVRAIKAGGGLVIAQDPASAEFEGMPRSAIDAGVVDHTLPTDEIPETLIRYAEHPYVREKPVPVHSEEAESPDESSITDGFNSVISLLKSRTKHDFRNYKDKTLIRRTRRRMCLHHIDDYDKYLEYLRTHPQEVEALASDLLISVTDFYREPEAWEELRRLAIQPLVEKQDHDEPIRVWTPGCATGEEPYSVAMLILEEIKKAEKSCPLNIFASDVDKQAIDYGRAGRYPGSIQADISAERLARFFTREDDDDYYQVNKALRETVVFADQNLIADPPFSKLDLICCRNLLIYLKPEVQEKVIALFHFALRENGVLFLGSAETIGRQTDLFQTLDKRRRIFRRVGPTNHHRVDIPLTTSGARREIQPVLPPAQRRETRLSHLAQQRLLDLLAPSAVLVNRDWNVLYICGDVDNYLTHKSGVPSGSLLDNARRGLRTKLRSAVHTALSEGRTVSTSARVQTPVGALTVTLTIRVIKDREQEEDLALIVFDDPERTKAEGEAPSRRPQRSGKSAARRSTEDDPGIPADEADLDDDAVLRQLEDELSDVKDDLQASIEQLEASNEEFKASNEEVMSINEELQSTNEELETSKEELQSLNEELATVNNQLAGKVEELETKHADLENLLAVTDVATICLDTDLAVRWFTPAAQKVIRLKPHDHGRPLADFAHDFTHSDLAETAQRVLKKLTPAEDEVTCEDDRTFLRRIHPYRADDHRIGGVVITFVDITRRKQSEDRLHQDAQRFRVLFGNSPSSLWELDCSVVRRWLDDLKASGVSDLAEYFQSNPDAVTNCLRKIKLTAANRASLRLFDAPHESSLQENMERLIDAESCGAIAGLLVVLAAPGTGFSGEVSVVTLTGQRKSAELCFQVVPGYEQSLEKVIVSLVDITDRKHAESDLRRLNDSLEQQVSHRTEMLKMLQDITRIANEAHTVEEAFATSMKRVCHFNGWQVGHVWRRVDDGSDDLVSSGIWTVRDDAEQAIGALDRFQEICRNMRFTPGQNLIGAVAQSGEPRWIDDIVTSTDWHHCDVRELGVHAVIAFPVTVQDETVAVLEFFSSHPAKRDQRFMEIMPDVGIQLGRVIERKRLERTVAETIEHEQYRIGRDMHDGIGQELSGLRYLAQTHAESLAQKSLPDASVAQRLATGFETIQKQLRTAIAALIPLELDNHGLASALDALAKCTAHDHAVKCDFVCGPSTSVDDISRATHIFRIAQEAVNNAVKHAQAQHIMIRLNSTESRLQLQVIDDGVGFDPASDKHVTGYGLHCMASRAEYIGALLEIAPGDSGGTVVNCTIPIEGSPAENS